MKWLETCAEPKKFNKMHIRLNLDKESKKLKRADLYIMVGSLLTGLGISKMVKETSLIGKSILEAYHHVEDTEKLSILLKKKKVELVQFQAAEDNTVTGKAFADSQDQVVNRLTVLMRRNSGKNMRKCILENVPEQIRDRVSDADLERDDAGVNS